MTGVAAPAIDWSAFDHGVQVGFDRMRLVGAAVAVVSSAQTLHTLTLGSRNRAPRRPVTATTRFVVASTTKAMSSALVASYVDDGVVGWDQKAVDAWSGFRAPTDELTRSLTIRDLLGMATGIEAPLPTDLYLGAYTPAQMLQSLVNLPVAGPPGRSFFYINGVYAAGVFLPLLASGVAPADLYQAYVEAMRTRIFEPAGMSGARIAADPRGLSADYATGYGYDLSGTPTELAYAAFGSTAPSSSALASLADHAAFVRLQLRRGLSVTGRRVVSEANLAECWKPGVAAPFVPDIDPDAVSKRYALGWFREEFTDGTTLLQHGGNVDGFSSLIAFLPEQDLGLVVLTNLDSSPFTDPYVLNLLLNELGINRGVPDKALAFNDAHLSGIVELGRQSGTVDLKAVTPHLGFYERGYSLEREGGDVQLRLGSRVWPLRQTSDGGYVMAHGFMLKTPVKLSRGVDGTPQVEIVGWETLRRNTAL
jgi:CubicO group peptidase (beta-lactamase class C family)